MSSLADRAVLITGVSRAEGIGAALAQRFAGEGARLFLTGWAPHDADQPYGEEPEGGERVARELGASFLSVDLADPEAPRQIFDAAADAVGRVDVLVANHARSARQTLSEVTAEELDLSFAVNARATLLLAREFAAQHDGSSGGRIVFFTSGQYHGAMPEELPYIASKAAVQQLTATLAVELGPRGITVNSVNPGPNDTGYATGELRRRVEEAMPRGRWGRPRDVAKLVVWLAGDEAEWVTGQTIASDGGWSARGAG
jgi:3-oxoacyl-[acyl-carrier protein] reductase